jgi:hypothetical protein
MDWLEEFWEDILSEEAVRTLAVWVKLDDDTKASVYEHLRRMASEEGWAEVQRAAAQAALDTIAQTDLPAK